MYRLLVKKKRLQLLSTVNLTSTVFIHNLTALSGLTKSLVPFTHSCMSIDVSEYAQAGLNYTVNQFV